jgi:sterol 3beta-glucosyltransferase
LQDNGAQVAVQTIYREIDRARALVKKHAKQDDDTDDFEEDWTVVGDDEDGDVDISQPFEMQQPVTGMNQAPTGPSQKGGGSLVLGGMAMKGMMAPKDAEYEED